MHEVGLAGVGERAGAASPLLDAESFSSMCDGTGFRTQHSLDTTTKAGARREPVPHSIRAAGRAPPGRARGAGDARPGERSIPASRARGMAGTGELRKDAGPEPGGDGTPPVLPCVPRQGVCGAATPPPPAPPGACALGGQGPLTTDRPRLSRRQHRGSEGESRPHITSHENLRQNHMSSSSFA
jgi:hypothetical protein